MWRRWRTRRSLAGRIRCGRRCRPVHGIGIGHGRRRKVMHHVIRKHRRPRPSSINAGNARAAAWFGSRRRMLVVSRRFAHAADVTGSGAAAVYSEGAGNGRRLRLLQTAWSRSQNTRSRRVSRVDFQNVEGTRSTSIQVVVDTLSVVLVGRVVALGLPWRCLSSRDDRPLGMAGAQTQLPVVPGFQSCHILSVRYLRIVAGTVLQVVSLGYANVIEDDMN